MRREDPDTDFSKIKRFIPKAKQQKQKARLSRIIKILKLWQEITRNKTRL